eukprot:COSAG01_NODE_48020_length_384_cov_49.424561_1_plen_85_part_00
MSPRMEQGSEVGLDREHVLCWQPHPHGEVIEGVGNVVAIAHSDSALAGTIHPGVVVLVGNSVRPHSVNDQFMTTHQGCVTNRNM